MLKEKNNTIRKGLLVVDLTLTVASFYLAFFIRQLLNETLGPTPPLKDYLLLLYIVLPLWGWLFYRQFFYYSIRTKGFVEITWTTFKTITTGGAVIMMTLYILKLGDISRSFILIFLCVNFAIQLSARSLICVIIHHLRKKGYNFRNMLIVGTGKRAKEFEKMIKDHKGWGINVIGFVDHKNKGGYSWPNKNKIIGPIDDLQETISAFQVDEVAFVLPRNLLDQIEDQILLCETIGIKACIAADFYPLAISKTSMDEIGGWPVISYNPTPKTESALYAKRVFDVMASSIALVVFSPLLLASMVTIKLSSPGSIFFAQERCGLNARKFKLLKFRTMVSNAEKLKSKFIHMNEMSEGPTFKIKNDPRITYVGSILRKYSIDELPQLINVLKGDMSIVGPRPPIPSEVEQYDITQRRRLSVKPGITCLWQVTGRNKIGFSEWVKLDLEYIDNWSWLLDIKIIFKTIPAVLKGTGS